MGLMQRAKLGLLNRLFAPQVHERIAFALAETYYPGVDVGLDDAEEYPKRFPRCRLGRREATYKIEQFLRGFASFEELHLLLVELSGLSELTLMIWLGSSEEFNPEPIAEEDILRGDWRPGPTTSVDDDDNDDDESGVTSMTTMTTVTKTTSRTARSLRCFSMS
jgi:hypothetical protein